MLSAWGPQIRLPPPACISPLPSLEASRFRCAWITHRWAAGCHTNLSSTRAELYAMPFGAVDRIRTGDPLLGKQMRYQLRHYRKGTCHVSEPRAESPASRPGRRPGMRNMQPHRRCWVTKPVLAGGHESIEPPAGFEPATFPVPGGRSDRRAELRRRDLPYAATRVRQERRRLFTRPPTFPGSHRSPSTIAACAGQGCPSHPHAWPRVSVVETRGLEPLTVCLQSRCTTSCATSPKGRTKPKQGAVSSTPPGARTPGPLIKSQMLYQLS